MEESEKLNSLSVNKMKEIVLGILKREGYNNLSENETFIIGETKEGLSNLKTAFYIYQKPLSGNDVELLELIKKINNSYQATKAHLITLVTGFSISGSVEKKLKRNLKFNFEVLEREKLTELINTHYPNFWMYQNFNLVAYEKFFLEEMAEKSALLNIQGIESKVKRLLDIYIKPRVYEVKGDLESNSTQLNRVQELDLVNRSKCCIIEGDTGSGKSTLLKEIGRLQIKKQEKLKTLPIFISPLLLVNSNYSIKNATVKLLKNRVSGTWDEIISSYKILFLVDNIDEFDKEEQVKISKELTQLSELNNVRFVITTRSAKTRKINSLFNDVDIFQIRKFNDLQIKEFTTRFFNDNGIAESLIEALEDFRILERLPLTPLSLSLIALVFEKENYEIPATISDIYDNFNHLILGKITANKKFELINFNFKERILSVYALEIIKNNKVRPFKKQQFIDFFKEYFKKKSSNVEIEVIEDFLEFFIKNSGILKMEEDYVTFSHKSFMEYYASLEVFKHKREVQPDLVENFLDLNWQNVAIFFAGQSKDMPDFLEGIIKRVRNATKLEEHNNAIMGLGYLLQALYQTDNKLREEAVLLSLDQSLIIHDWYKKIISDGDILFFKKMRFPALTIFNMYFYYLNFLSSTLTEPLDLAFKRLFKTYLKEPNTSTGYQLLTIAAIFHSKRIHNSSYLKKLVYDSHLLKDPYLVTVAEFALYFDSSLDHKEIKQELHKTYTKMKPVTKALVSTPANRLRFSSLDLLSSNKKVTIITEGPTDVEIIEHAYTILTNGSIPYWTIRPAGINDGGAKEVKFTLDKCKPLTNNESVIIGIFDHDTEGCNQFKGLNFNFHKEYKRVKKMDKCNVYGLKLPVPDFRKKYIEQEPENYYLSIEHYFDDEILKKFDIIKESGIPGIYKIKKGKGIKSKFSKHIKSLNEAHYFRHFIPLFETIDDICDFHKNDYYQSI